MAFAPGDEPAERGHEREAWDAQVVCPGLPDPGLIDECLADVENDRLNALAGCCHAVPRRFFVGLSRSVMHRR